MSFCHRTVFLSGDLPASDSPLTAEAGLKNPEMIFRNESGLASRPTVPSVRMRAVPVSGGPSDCSAAARTTKVITDPLGERLPYAPDTASLKVSERELVRVRLMEADRRLRIQPIAR